MLDILRQTTGVIRSVWIYHLRDRERHARMDALHGRFVREGHLVFDIGSHVGDRMLSFKRLGCRVVAVEPQPMLVKVLRWLARGNPGIAIEASAIGARSGEIDLHLNLANPTVSTGSTAFIAAADGAPGWTGQRWTRRTRVPMTTLDALIARHGIPRFIKIDVEGLEDQVLQGLSQPLPALSFEFTTIQPDIAKACVQRCVALSDRYRFNAALGESQQLVHNAWLSAAEILTWLAGLPQQANSGDVYARLPAD